MSRLLHGGLRYLAQGRLGLVHEASVEKCILHKIAPHLAMPLAFIFPTYRGTEWPLWKLKIGVKLYDLLCGGRNLGPSSWMNVKEAQENVPGISSKNLTGAVRYFDGLTNDARLVLDSLRSAAKHDAILCNYTRFENSEPTHDGWRCFLKDLLTGKSFELQTRCVVNASGPWADQIKHSSIALRVTKGVHLVVDHSRLPITDAVMFGESNRIVFALPWNERVVLGTTDTDYKGTIEDVRTDSNDIEYLLSVMNTIFPGAALTGKDVRSSWAGIRPLIANPKGGPSDISRAHQIRMPKPGWIDVAGGKLTTYRRMAEQTVDLIFNHIGRNSPACKTGSEPLLNPSDAEGISSFVPPPVTRKAVEHYLKNEWAIHLDDVLVRRSGWHYYVANADQVAEQVCGWMAEIQGWDANQGQDELNRYYSKVDPKPSATIQPISKP
jgi:glycerol-3-phosphate dehydrogenase